MNGSLETSDEMVQYLSDRVFNDKCITSKYVLDDKIRINLTFVVVQYVNRSVKKSNMVGMKRKNNYGGFQASYKQSLSDFIY